MVDVTPVEGAEGAHLLDTEGFNAKQYCGVYILTGDPAVIVEAGASPTVDRVLAALDRLGVAREDVAYVAPTHIHLDHAGATGHLLEALPNARAVLHHRYADYLINPEKLLESVKRAVGERFPQYGTCKPLDPERVTRVKGGETLTAGDRALSVHHAPGHAPHHVVYLDEGDGTLYTGDAAGIHLPANDATEETTPPPAFDLPAYLDTLEMMRGLEPARLALTHFGVRGDADAHLEAYARLLQAWVAEVRGAWSRHAELDAVVGQVDGNHREWWPAYDPADRVAVRRMDVEGVLHYLRRAGAIE